MNPSHCRSAKWLLVTTFILTTLVTVLPLAREYPRWLHEFAVRLSFAQRALAILGITSLIVWIMSRLSWPRVSRTNLLAFLTTPPLWVSFLVAGTLGAAWDVAYGLDSHGHQGTAAEWIGYVGGAVAIVAIVRAISAKHSSNLALPAAVFDEPQAMTDSDEDLIDWLGHERLAASDYFGYEGVVSRIESEINGGATSIGVVGPFGSGKSSVIRWAISRLSPMGLDGAVSIIPSYHSCWHFADSASAVDSILADVVEQVETRVDASFARGLPTAYRRIVSQGREWLTEATSLILGSDDYGNQFRRINELLASHKIRVVLIVEDIDRSNSREFDAQQLLGFLQLLRSLHSFTVIISGGYGAEQKIDFEKLCDSVQYIGLLDRHAAAKLIDRIRSYCLDAHRFPHHRFDDTRSSPWNPSLWDSVRPSDISQADAYLRLVTTPRTLKHVLRKTLRAWERIFGEVDFDSLLAVNAIKVAAPDAYSFLRASRHRLVEDGSSRIYRENTEEALVKRLREDWQRFVSRVEFDDVAAQRLIEWVFPNSIGRLTGHRSTSHRVFQGPQNSRYWNRIEQEGLEQDAVRDQVVAGEINDWLADGSEDSSLVHSLTTRHEYSQVFEAMASRWFLQEPELILRLCSNVIARLARDQGSEASADSPGFIVTWRLAVHHIGRVPNLTNWICTQSQVAVGAGLPLANAVAYYWCTDRLVDPVQKDLVENAIRRMCIRAYGSGETLVRAVSHSDEYVLARLFRPMRGESTEIRDLRNTWLSRVATEALFLDPVLLAPRLAWVFAEQHRGRRDEIQIQVHADAFLSVFGVGCSRMIDAMDAVTAELQGADAIAVRHLTTRVRRELQARESALQSQMWRRRKLSAHGPCFPLRDNVSSLRARQSHAQNRHRACSRFRELKN